MKRCVIIGAAPISDYSLLKEMIKTSDYIICADGGYIHAMAANIAPDLLVGDFDSVDRSKIEFIDVLQFSPEKDSTDLMLAVQEGISRKFELFLIFGATGGRLDHTLANLTILSYLCDMGAEAWIIDEKNMAMIIKNKKATIPNRIEYKFSVLAWGGMAYGLTIRSMKYKIENYNLSCSDPRAISNEFIGLDAEVEVKKGKVLIVLSKD